MPVDPFAPVLVGVGQVEQRAEPADALEPAELMAQAIRDAAVDSGAPGLAGSIAAVMALHTLSWPYDDVASEVGRRLGADPHLTMSTVMGGNYPQTLVNRAAEEIANGRLESVAICGAETWRTRAATRRGEAAPEWTPRSGNSDDEVLGVDDPELTSPEEVARGVLLPAHVYPMFDVALRADEGLGIDDHRQRIAELWAGFSRVAATNPHAWIRRAFTADEVGTPSSDNRMIGFPYTKLMCSNNNVEQAAAVVLCSAERAADLGIPRDRWVFLHSGTDAHDHWWVSERDRLDSSPAIRLAGRRALELAGTSADDIAHVDLYSCFPSAVQVAARELGLGRDRQLTVTGGMSFAGGPWNNYVTHAIATMASVLRDDPGSTGLVTANGGYLTKHAFGVYSTEPPPDGYRSEDLQRAVDATPRRHAAHGYAGAAMVETYTVVHDRSGAPEVALAALRTPDDGRTWGRCTDPVAMASMETEEWVGRSVRLDDDGSFTPT
ncbi:MAG: acetyl-CoA acetyltransferase [Acidimicrobiia bacterium]|nr:acetyl-CoA acetyltransferase [Acidimicrobiia bacterium]